MALRKRALCFRLHVVMEFSTLNAARHFWGLPYGTGIEGLLAAF
jgi:hypothetical protein